MKKKSNVKGFIGLILMAISFLAIVVCGVVAIVLEWTNPDMTEIRLFLTYPWPTVGCFASLIVGWIGYAMAWE